MKGPQGTVPIVLARRLRNYQPGDKVKIIRGDLASRVMTVRENAADHVSLAGTPRRDIMSKGNIEPLEGFTKLEMENAEKLSRQGA